MRILIEEYQYNVTDVKDTLYGIDALENVEGKVSVHYGGFYYNTLQRDCVFILPKVLLMDDKSKDSKKANLVFGKYRPEEILDLDEHNPLTKEERDFVYKFAVWIYRAILRTMVCTRKHGTGTRRKHQSPTNQRTHQCCLRTSGC